MTTGNFLVKLFEHNNWANDKIIQACLALNDQQLDAEPSSATQGSIRSTLAHLVRGQRGYLRLLTLPVEERRQPSPDLAFAELQASAIESGEALLALVRDEASLSTMGRREETEGWFVEPWVLLVQVINHATEHREQIKSMLTALGVTPPNIDGWDYGEVTDAYTPNEN
jgi:uncharacterized damage-inducible protein DinB